MAKIKDLKLNKLLDEDELKDDYLDSMILKYNLVKFSKDKDFPHNMALNYATLFDSVLKKPHIGKNYIFEIEEIESDIIDFVKKNNNELKLILTADLLSRHSFSKIWNKNIFCRSKNSRRLK